MKSILIYSTLFIFCFYACNNKNSNQSINLSTSSIEKKIVLKDTILQIANKNHFVKVSIKIPEKEAIGTIVVLPGWNHPANNWCTKTEFCSKALQKGYVLILVDMIRSIYSKRTYIETRKDWRIYPTRKWFTDTLITYIQKNYNLLQENQNNLIIGLSTGARGVALLCLDCPKIFKKAAALSGDYDQTKMPEDALCISFYGEMSKFAERWNGGDNVINRISEFKTPIYLAHGKLDKIVPCNQTELFYEVLKKQKPELQVKCSINPNADHNYKYWDSEVDSVLEFFQRK